MCELEHVCTCARKALQVQLLILNFVFDTPHALPQSAVPVDHCSFALAFNEIAFGGRLKTNSVDVNVSLRGPWPLAPARGASQSCCTCSGDVLFSAGQWSALPPVERSHLAQAAPARVLNAPDRA